MITAIVVLQIQKSLYESLVQVFTSVYEDEAAFDGSSHGLEELSPLKISSVW